MSWFSGSATRIFEREMKAPLAILRETSDYGLGLTCILTNHCRRLLEQDGFNVSHPHKLVVERPSASFELVRIVQRFQKIGQPSIGAGFVIWVHTVRASYAMHSAIKPKAIELWKELSRGFPHAPAHLSFVQAMLNIPISIDGYDRFPEGFDPHGSDIDNQKY